MNHLKDRVAISIMKIEHGLGRMAVRASKACIRLADIFNEDVFRRTERFIESYPDVLDDPKAEKAWNELKQFHYKK